jgi:hypothetical protein
MEQYEQQFMVLGINSAHHAGWALVGEPMLIPTAGVKE